MDTTASDAKSTTLKKRIIDTNRYYMYDELHSIVRLMISIRGSLIHITIVLGLS